MFNAYTGEEEVKDELGVRNNQVKKAIITTVLYLSVVCVAAKNNSKW